MKTTGAFVKYFKVRGNGVAHADVKAMLKDPSVKQRLTKMANSKVKPQQEKQAIA